MSADGELPGMWEESDLSGGWADTDGMTARERLLGDLISLGQERCVGQVERDQCRADAERLVDAFAHELAEKQWAYAEEEWAGNDARMILRRRVARHLADLIDPAKESDRG